MKKIYSLILFLAILLGGCTQNNGHIGPIFGTWALVEVTLDGEPQPLSVETMFSFQNEIVKVTRLVNYPFEREDRFGNFHITDDTLVMEFQNKPTESGSHMYMYPEWIPFPGDGKPVVFDIRQLNGRKMVLDLDSDGRRYTYEFDKTW